MSDYELSLELDGGYFTLPQSSMSGRYWRDQVGTSIVGSEPRTAFKPLLYLCLSLNVLDKLTDS